MVGFLQKKRSLYSMTAIMGTQRIVQSNDVFTMLAIACLLAVIYVASSDGVLILAVVLSVLALATNIYAWQKRSGRISRSRSREVRNYVVLVNVILCLACLGLAVYRLMA